jgi:hypothetical protein
MQRGHKETKKKINRRTVYYRKLKQKLNLQGRICSYVLHKPVRNLQDVNSLVLLNNTKPPMKEPWKSKEEFQPRIDWFPHPVHVLINGSGKETSHWIRIRIPEGFNAVPELGGLNSSIYHVYKSVTCKIIGPTASCFQDNHLRQNSNHTNSNYHYFVFNFVSTNLK